MNVKGGGSKRINLFKTYLPIREAASKRKDRIHQRFFSESPPRKKIDLELERFKFKVEA